MTALAQQALAVIRQKAPNFKAKVGIILGSGLGAFADNIQDAIQISYADLPGFSTCTVAGHKGILHLGYINGVPVACLQGRAHYYEGVTPDAIKTLVRTLHLLGCENLLITNASGSLRLDVMPGSVVLITDHINFQGTNPLAGKNDEEFGPRFLGMDDTYDLALREKMKAVAVDLDIPLPEGVYISVLGPAFETPAEIRAFKLLGADLVGMSTVPEVIVARHCGMKVVALAAVSNLAAGLSKEKLSHELTLSGAKLAADNLTKIVLGFIAK